MASHEAASVAVFPTNLQSHPGSATVSLVKETTPVTLPPPANSVQHLACTSNSQSPAVNVVEKAYPPHNLSPAKTADVDGSAFINSNKYLKLNVGGSLHYTTMGTLTKEDNMLRAMFSGRMVVLTDSEGWILIDRCGKHFGSILNYLRDGSITLPESRYEIAELLAEAKYYLIQGLVAQCEAMLEKKSKDVEPLCMVPIITSHKEEQELVKKSKRPIVKFLYNRGNNKYSYTNLSDDNMLKNIEVFDKLSLRFNGRILFIKAIAGDEICVWSFYGKQRKMAEICCTSIVYATDKKQTKVEFPEARIYEETLNILLCEENVLHQPPVSDINDFLKGHHYQSDDDGEDKAHRVRRIHVNSNRPL